MSQPGRARISLVLTAVATLTACSSSSPSSSSSSARPAAPTTTATVTVDQACIDEYVTSMNALDLSDINPIDGLDATEQAKLDAQLAAVAAQHPDLAPGGRCHVLLDQSASLDDTTVQQIIGRLKPDVLATLSYRPH